VTIRGIILDYGGVIWDMRWDIARSLSVEHGLEERAVVEAMYRNELWQPLEIGVGEREVWLAAVQTELDRQGGKPMPPLHRHWQERQHLIEPNIVLIRRLRPAYKTQVLSNADTSLRDKLRRIGVHDLFDDIVVSGEVRVAKPDQRIYALAAERIGLAPEECVFVDDLEPNVTAAREAGMTGIHFRVDLGHDLTAMLSDVGVVT
jgi:putative hydrolase of the HAD superfamily